MLRMLDNAGVPLSDRDEEARLRAAVAAMDTAAAADSAAAATGPAPGEAEASSSDEEESGEESEEDTRTIAAVRPGVLQHRLPPLPLSARLHTRSKVALRPAPAKGVEGDEERPAASPRHHTHPLLSLGLKVAVSIGMAAWGPP